MVSLSDEVIVLFNKKKESAFELVFNMYYPRLVYFAKEYVSYDDAKNLVQDAFITLWNKKPEFGSESQLRSYLYLTVKNNCLMHLRHEKVRDSYNNQVAKQQQNQIFQVALENIDTSELILNEINAIVDATVEVLPPRCREIFVLSRFEGKKNQEVAEELNISLKSVEAQITKALKIFKKALIDYLPLLISFLVIGK
ncbi:RNA polymerase sigma-70 factor [Labilibaculum antarcticum]|uniref:RNA polymerase sigma-70 factor n=1 Tax=Labilibaculum antarcticum TaxID=1717717 RepID=A0A1Y1CDP8_9BACT|nr:RNA polymerase sigma-70 factor [Labilibaculum antarcticum]BAX78455.1 RNA polymerase sigma-70 factor [Labilibaculum antarcticum]